MGTLDSSSSAIIDRRFKHLQKTGYWFWSAELAREESNHLLSELKRTRPTFIAMLETSNIHNIVSIIMDPPDPLTRSLAVKHAMIATDAGAELLDRAKDYFAFHEISSLHIEFGEKMMGYSLRALGTTFKSKLSNKKIAAAKAGLLQDVCTLLVHGSRIKELKRFPSFRTFNIGEICGKPDLISEHFAELYLLVSRQIKGVTTASSGNRPQQLVKEKFSAYFSGDVDVSPVPGNRVPGVGDEQGQQFDLVYRVKRTAGQDVFIAIEIAFQETTNSVIERKSKQARELFKIFKDRGYYLCFVVDGAGYFARPKALRDIIANSDICVTFSQSELEKLCEFVANLRNQG